MVDTPQAHSTHKALLIASLGANVALAIVLQKGWLDDVPDGLVAVICVIPVLSFLGWLWIHPLVKKRRYVLYIHAKMSFVSMVVSCGLIGALIGGFLWWATNRANRVAEGKISEVVNKQESVTPAPDAEYSGTLIPANDPNPPDPPHCQVPPDVVRVFLGNSLGWAKGGIIRVVSLNGVEALTIIHTAAGIVIEANVLSSDKRYVAMIENNQFRRNPNTSWYHKRPDSSTLAIYDDYKRELLYVRYANPNVVIVRGIFHSIDGKPLIIGEDKIIYSNGTTMERVCVGETMGSLIHSN